MSSSTTTPGVSTTLSTLFRSACAGLFALLLLVLVQPAHAQDSDDLPTIDFSVDLMQSAQYLSLDQDGTDPIAGFHAMRAGLNTSVQFSENVSGLLMLQSEPNDFAGASGAAIFQPQVDFAILNLQLSDNLTFQTGTPVTGLLNFRGFSDGPVVQGNPMIGNSLADMITAGQGIKLIGSYETVGFDVTVNRGFGEDLTNLNGGNTGVNIIGKARYTGHDVFKFGGGIGLSTGSGVGPNGPDNSNEGLIFANGDRENYNLGSVTGGTNSTATHANIPSGTIAQVDGKVTTAGADVDLWLGYGTESDVYPGDDDTFTALFGGLGLKYDLTDDFYAAGRFSYAGDQSDAVSDADDTAMSRIQLGIGYMVYDKALLKVEYVTQSEADNTALSRISNDWQGVTTELSFNF
jgi:hypothetical protein